MLQRAQAVLVLGELMALGLGADAAYKASTDAIVYRLEPRKIDGAIVRLIDSLGHWPEAIGYLAMAVVMLCLAWHNRSTARSR